MSEPEAVRKQVEKIVTSDGFVNSARLCRFLRFTVDATLEGRGDQVKEYLLGREVFDRKDDYDPRMDPIVRVEARRLRAKLEEYYAGAGRMDQIRIELPKGSYVPIVRSASEDQRPLPKTFPWRIVAGAILLIAAVLSIYRLALSPRREMVAVVPARWLLREGVDPDTLEDSLAETIAAELANRGVARVIAWPSILRYRTGRNELRAMAAELGATKVMIVSVRRDRDAMRGTVFFVDSASGQKMWVADYSRKVLAPLEAQRELARAVVDEFEAKQREKAS